jgi:asparagine synthase (glutamine-hydrolysing)
MCGIAGSLDLRGRPASPVIVRRMTDAIAHRGPDGEGVYTDGPLGLGHRRLAIIDLSPAGHQPMVTPDSRYVITYNGELYNFQELRAELEALGHPFHSRTDTEVVLRGYVQWGPALLDRLNGMFAFALWDRTKKELFLARDRYGVKPLYYGARDGVFVFGSEAKALLAHPSMQASVDREGLVEYLTFQNFLTDRTLFEGIRLLPAGHFLRLAAGEPEVPAARSYWDYHFEEVASPRPDADYAEELDVLLRQAVSRQMVADVDVGSYLSGGMDSGTLTALAAPQVPVLRTFTCGFDLSSASGMELGFDERAKAELMSYRFKTEHYEMVLKAGDMERVMPRLVNHLEEPRVGQSYPNFYAAQLASKFVKVVLAGTGGDELFGGYPWRYYRAVVNDDFEHYVDKYYAYWQRLVPTDLMAKVVSPMWADVKHVSTRDVFRDVFQTHASELRRPEDYVNHSLYFEAKTFLHGLFVVEDKLSMAHGLENRVPFLDNDLVEFAQRLPVRLKLARLDEATRVDENTAAKRNAYLQKTNDGKVLLRQVMARHIPAEVAHGTKQGFSAPDASWFKGESIDYVRRTVLDPRARIYEYLDYDTVARLVGDHLEGRENRRLLIWSLLNINGWLRRFIP